VPAFRLRKNIDPKTIVLRGPSTSSLGRMTGRRAPTHKHWLLCGEAHR